MPDNPWNSERGRAARKKMGLAVDVPVSPGSDLGSLRDFAREWLVERGWEITCTPRYTFCCRDGIESEGITDTDYDLALVAAIEATKGD